MTSALHSWVIHNLTDYHRIFYGPLQSPQTTADKWKAWHDGFLFRLWWHPTHVTPLSIMLTNVQTGWTSPPDKLTDPLDSTITPSGFSLYLLERCVEATGKAKGGGMRFFINNKWCTDVKTVSQMLTLTKFWTSCAQPICKPWHPDALSVIMGNFNHCNLKTMLAKYYQHVTYPMRRKK